MSQPIEELLRQLVSDGYNTVELQLDVNELGEVSVRLLNHDETVDRAFNVQGHRFV